MNYTLPSKVFEANLPRLLHDLAVLDSSEGPSLLDFRRVEYWIPAAIVSLCAIANRWSGQGREVFFQNVQSSPDCGYLQRIDFFERVGLRLPENFHRRAAGTSFVEIQQIDPGTARLNESLARALAECLAGTTDFQRMVAAAGAAINLTPDQGDDKFFT